MSNNTEHKITKSSSKYIDWIEDAIGKRYFKYYDYEHLSDVKEIGCGSFGKVYCAKWKNIGYVALKSFFIFNNNTAGEIVKELQLQREVDFHDNVIRFLGFTSENEHGPKEYLLVMEYADGGTLKSYLKENFNEITWDDKLGLALQLASAVLCLHSERIVHRDLHSGNVLIHRKKIKLADFGLSKRMDNAANPNSKLFGVIPYIDPKSFSKSRTHAYTLNEKSDVYSIGVLLWEISSGRPPFGSEGYDIGLAMQIIQGLREDPVPDTPEEYVKLYTNCWDSEPNNRPTINYVVDKLDTMAPDMPDSVTPSILSPSFLSSGSDDNPSLPISELSRLIQEVDIGELEPDNPSYRNITHDFNRLVCEMVNLPNKVGDENIKKDILNYLNNSNISEQEIYDWLLNNQDDSNAVVLLGKFHSLGIKTKIDKKRAFELYQEATEMGNESGMSQLGYCYGNGIGTDINKKKAFELFQKSVNLDNAFGINMLGYCYQHGIETNINKQKAFELFQKAAELGNANAINNLACCYDHGIGIDIDKEKAFELYEKAAELEESTAQYNLAQIYEEIKKDLEKAKHWYFKSAEQGDQDAKNKLDEFILKEEEKDNEFFVI